MEPRYLVPAFFALGGCDFALTAMMAPALPVLIPVAILAENADDPDRTIQPVRVVTAPNRVLAAPAGDVEIEETFTVTRRTIACKSTGESRQLGLSITRGVACGGSRTGTFRNGDPLTRYNPIELTLGEGAARIVCRGAYEGNLEKGRALPFVIPCDGGGQAAVVSSVTDDAPAVYSFWINLS